MEVVNMYYFTSDTRTEFTVQSIKTPKHFKTTVLNILMTDFV